MHVGIPTRIELRAASEILDRALGRPAQAIDIELAVNQKLTELSLHQLQLLEERLSVRAGNGRFGRRQRRR